MFGSKKGSLLKVLSEIRQENNRWVFDYLSDSDPRVELRRASALIVEQLGVDPGTSMRHQNGQYKGMAYTLPNSATALTVVQARLLGWGWNLTAKIDQ